MHTKILHGDPSSFRLESRLPAQKWQVKVSKEVKKFLLSKDTCRILTFCRDGYLRCVLVGCYYDKRLIYIVTNSASVKAKNLKEQPNCSVIVD
jgi:nitroimidazol reductase NimA-like FMN-containing flavoprotein (pyridoxamine 5'-phosphate oxidase superfamily)